MTLQFTYFQCVDCGAVRAKVLFSKLGKVSRFWVLCFRMMVKRGLAFAASSTRSPADVQFNFLLVAIATAAQSEQFCSDTASVGVDAVENSRSSLRWGSAMVGAF
jgi:hypothetical protein